MVTLRKSALLLQHCSAGTLVEPERVIQFRVVWWTTAIRTGSSRVARQFNMAYCPVKADAFHPAVNLSILKFLASADLQYA